MMSVDDTLLCSFQVRIDGTTLQTELMTDPKTRREESAQVRLRSQRTALVAFPLPVRSPLPL